MKHIHLIIGAVLATVLASCMGSDYAEPDYQLSPYGNNKIDETNVVTIAALKADAKYKNVITNSGLKEITDDVKIRARVTGNDVMGNIYNEVAVDDGTGALLITISQGGLYSYLPVGQEILVSLKGMYIGGYRQQPQVGALYINPSTGAKSVGRMNRQEWEQHFRIMGTPQPEAVVAEDFDVTKISDAAYLAEKAGKLMTLRSVEIAEANGTAVYAPDDGSVTLTSNAANRSLRGLSSNSIVLRTSTYADFANTPMPTGKVNITGIFTRFGNVWQILMRSTDDIETADPFAGIDGTGEGTEASPLNVARAMSMIAKGAYDANTEYYITGIISSVKEISTSYGNATYYISDDGTATGQLTVFRGYWKNGDKFTAEDQLKAGQKVTILGKLTLYNSESEVAQGNKVISVK